VTNTEPSEPDSSEEPPPPTATASEEQVAASTSTSTSTETTVQPSFPESSSPPAPQILAWYSNTILWIVLAALGVVGLIAVMALRRPQSVKIAKEGGVISEGEGDVVNIHRRYGSDSAASQGSAEKTCPKCGRSYPNDFRYCTECEGVRLI